MATPFATTKGFTIKAAAAMNPALKATDERRRYRDVQRGKAQATTSRRSYRASDRSAARALICLSPSGQERTTTPRQKLWVFPTGMVDGVKPPGSCMKGANAFPERFLGLVVMGVCRDDNDASEWTTTGLAKFIGPSASANVLGRANAIASAIVASFMGVSFSCYSDNIGKSV
jgi:hypothetical protein